MNGRVMVISGCGDRLGNQRWECLGMVPTVTNVPSNFFLEAGWDPLQRRGEKEWLNVKSNRDGEVGKEW